jgi:hypothetical protein
MFKDRVEKFVNSIDFTPLTEMIRDHMDIPNLEINYWLEQRGHNFWIAFRSNELIEYATVMKSICRSIRVEEMGSSIKLEDEYDENSPLNIWISIDLRYDHVGGGSNGHTIAYARYNELRKKWEFDALS